MAPGTIPGEVLAGAAAAGQVAQRPPPLRRACTPCNTRRASPCADIRPRRRRGRCTGGGRTRRARRRGCQRQLKTARCRAASLPTRLEPPRQTMRCHWRSLLQRQSQPERSGWARGVLRRQRRAWQTRTVPTARAAARVGRAAWWPPETLRRPSSGGGSPHLDSAQ